MKIKTATSKSFMTTEALNVKATYAQNLRVSPSTVLAWRQRDITSFKGIKKSEGLVRIEKTL